MSSDDVEGFPDPRERLRRKIKAAIDPSREGDLVEDETTFKLSGVRFTRDLSLTSIRLPTLTLSLCDCSFEFLVLSHCEFGVLELGYSHARRIELHKYEGDKFSAQGLVITDHGDLSLSDVKLIDALDLSRARVDGRLLCRSAGIRCKECPEADDHKASPALACRLLTCRRIETGSDVDLLAVEVTEEIDLVSAGINGTLTCTGRVGTEEQTSGCEERVALRANGMNVKGDLRLGDPDRERGERDTGKLRIFGEVRLVEAYIEHDTNLTNAEITHPGAMALDAEHAIIEEDLYLNEEFKAAGLVRLVGARVTGLVNCTSGTFLNRYGIAINADGLVATSVYLNSGEETSGKEREKFLAEGTIRVEGAKIRRELLLSGAQVTAVKAGPDGAHVVLAGNNLEAQTLRLDQGCKLRGGSVVIGGARVSGGVYCTSGTFEAPSGCPALRADGAQLGDLMLDGEFVGEVSIREATVTGRALCSGGKFHNPQGPALTADRLTCGAFYINEPFFAEGTVSLWGARLNYMDCRGGLIRGDMVRRIPTTISGAKTFALDLSETEIKGHVLGQGVRIAGGLSLANADISGDFDLTGALISPGDQAREQVTLNGRGLTVGGTLSWQLASRPDGKVNLSQASVGRLRDDLRSWPWPCDRRTRRQVSSGLNLNGFRYGGLDEDKAAPVKERLGWLASARPFSQQPYEELARVYRDRGQVSDAGRVRLREQKERTRHARLPPLLKAWNLFLEWAVGYGYRPGRIFLVLVSFAIAGGFLFHVAQHNDVMEAVGYHPDRCLQTVSVVGTRGTRDVVVVEVRGGEQKGVVSIGRDTAPTEEKIKGELPPELGGLNPAPPESALLPPCRVPADKCTSYYPCFHPAVYSTELLIPVVNLRQLTYWLPDQSANREGPWYLHGIWYLTFAWMAILLGWVSVTALAAGISHVWRSD